MRTNQDNLMCGLRPRWGGPGLALSGPGFVRAGIIASAFSGDSP